MAASRMSAFLENLRAADVLKAGQLDEITRNPLSQGDDPMPLARDLVQRGLLTSYQANQLVRGQGKELVLGPYRLMERIGEGGMGQVFKTYHKPMNRIVALKVIRQDRLDNPDAVKRFHREVQSTGQLVHPNIVVAYDAGQVGNTHYLAMEFIEGADLLKQVKETGALAVGQACDIIRQAAMGLQHAHERGLVHRDIKPSNLMVAAGGQVKILDLGLARAQNNDGSNNSTLTRIGSIVGTPEFLAPEQAKNSSDVDIRADLYALGCTFYYLLAGQAPFRGDSPTDVMLKHHTDQAASLETFRGDVPAGVQAIVKKLMAKKPEDRFQTPGELIEALAPFGRGKEPRGGRSGKRKAGAVAKPAPGSIIKVRGPTGSRGGTRALILGGVALAALVALVAVVYPSLTQSAHEPAPGTPAAAAKPTQPDEPTSARWRPATATTKPRETGTEDTKTTPPRAPDPSKKPADSRKPLPDWKKVQDVRQAIQQERKLDGNSAVPMPERVELAKKTLKEALEAQDDLRQVALLMLACDLWGWAGDLDATLSCYDELEKRYDMDALLWKVNQLERLSGTELPTALMKIVVVKALDVLGEALHADRYDLAARLPGIADKAAKKTKDKKLEAHVQQRQGEFTEVRDEYARVKPLLGQKMDGAENAGKVGAFLACFKGAWDDGLPFLARSNRANLKALAERDLARARGPAEQEELGDAWLRFADSAAGVARTNTLLRARHWYQQALAQSPADTAPPRLAKKIAEVDRRTGRDTLAVVPAEPDPKLVKVLEAARTAYNQGKEPEMVQAYNEALKLTPDPEGARQVRYELHMCKGFLALARKNYAVAEKEFASALVERPNDAIALARRDEARAKKP
jgi:serine/threonine-protein kinase